MTQSAHIALICAPQDRSVAWTLAERLLSRNVKTVVGWNASADPAPAWLVVCHSAAAADDIALSRAITDFTARIGRARIVRVGIGPDGDAPPPVLTCERGADGLLVAAEPPPLAGVLHHADEAEALARRLLSLTGWRAPRKAVSRFATPAMAAALALCLGLSVYAGLKLHQSEAARADAERFADTLLLDVGETLQASARQTVMISASERLLERQDARSSSGLTDEDLARRLHLLTWLAEAQDLSGDPAGAERTYAAAVSLSESLIDRAPNRVDIVQSAIDLMSSLASSAYRAGDVASAASAIAQSRQLASLLVRISPDAPEARLQLARTSVNAGAMSLQAGDPERAFGYLNEALVDFQNIESATLHDVGAAHSWLADTHRALGSLTGAREAREREAAIYAEIAQESPSDALSVFRHANALRAQASLEIDMGEIDRAAPILEQASSILSDLVMRDPDSARYRRLRMTVERDRAELALFSGDLIRAKLLADGARRYRAMGDAQGGDDGRGRENANFLLVSGRIAFQSGQYDQAIADAVSAIGELNAPLTEDLLNARQFALSAHLLQYEAAIRASRPEAPRILRSALELIPDHLSQADTRLADAASRILLLAGRSDQAQEIRDALRAAGYARPDFEEFWSRSPSDRRISTREDISHDG